MEKSLEKHLEETFKLPGVNGIICTDNQGLCIGSKGSARTSDAGPICNLAKQADELIRTQKPAVICLECDSGSVMLSNKDTVTMAIFKSE